MIPKSLSNLRSSDGSVDFRDLRVLREVASDVEAVACLFRVEFGRILRWVDWPLEANFSFGNSLAERWSVKVYQKCACRERVDFRP